MLSRFSIIVAIDHLHGIAKDGTMPWHSSSDMKFFRDATVGSRKNNAVIFGRKTYETIPPNFRPLEHRSCYVISRSWLQEDFREVKVCESIKDALQKVCTRKYDEVFVAGGEQIYREIIENYLYLCDKIYVTKFKNDFACDQFFPWDEVKDLPRFKDTEITKDYNRHFISPNVNHEEYQYLNLLSKILDKGEPKKDRTGVGCNFLFGNNSFTFDISERIPIITTKKVNYKSVIEELLFFISGNTNTNNLNTKIWKGNTSRDFLDSKGLLDYTEGDMGPGYSFQWRHWGANYTGCEDDYTDQGIDQLQNLIDGIRNNPESRRHILSSWNVSQLNEMALPPCHCLAQFSVSGDSRHLDCQLYQRSADMFLGVPFNIASYSILTYMIAHITNLKPRYFHHVFGDAHIYNNHEKQVIKQLKRTPFPFPRLSFRKPAKLRNIDDFDMSSFIIEDYESWEPITAKMAV